jgi:hypothetical protein
MYDRIGRIAHHSPAGRDKLMEACIERDHADLVLTEDLLAAERGARCRPRDPVKGISGKEFVRGGYRDRGPGHLG